jgi:hypothetical protein
MMVFPRKDFGREAEAMAFRGFLILGLVLAAVGSTPAQDNSATAWRSVDSGSAAGASTAGIPTAGGQTAVAAAPVGTAATAPAASPAAEARQPIAKVTAGSGSLPREQGQVWREYDIAPYTSHVTNASRPEQAIVDWILRETGYEAWHTEPFAILSANSKTLLVYHTPQMQAVVADIVDRFISSQAEAQAFALHVITLNQPNWRARAQQLMQPVPVQTPGVQAWILEKEGSALLLADMARRSDFREHNSPNLTVNNGQSTLVAATRGVTYVRSVAAQPAAWMGFEPQNAVIDEGYSLEFSPLLSVDGKLIDATIKCHIDQVEKLVSVLLDMPTAYSPRQRAKIDVPQVSSVRFHERFRWPVDKVLMVSLGVVPLPVPADGRSVVPGIPLPIPTGPARAEVLVVVENKGRVAQPAVAGVAPVSTQAVPVQPQTYPVKR